MIDNSLVQGYSFQAKALAWRKEAPIEPVTWGGATTAKLEVTVPHFPDFDWTSLKTAYLGPDDPKLVRCQYLKPWPNKDCRIPP